jgi:hypothetical protein
MTPPPRPARCPAAVTCAWHDRVRVWLTTGQIGKIKEQADVIHVLIGRAWHACQCGLIAQVRAHL